MKNIGGTLYQRRQGYNLSLAVNSYYKLPVNIIEDAPTFKKLLTLAAKESYREHIRKVEFAQKNKLRTLPNLTLRHERLLKRIRCYSVSDFMEMGALNIVTRLMKKGIELSLSLILDFFGAEKKKWVSDLTMEEKCEIVEVVNSALISLGFRAFDINELENLDTERRKPSLLDLC